MFFTTFDMDKVEKICRHRRKEHLKISKIAKFESDLLKTNEDIALQIREIWETFVSGGGGGGGRGTNVSLTIQKSVKIRNSVELYLRSFKTFRF